MTKPYNRAQLVLMSIGGNALLVGGYMQHYWADNQTQSKQKQRQNRLGNYGSAIMAHFAAKRKAGHCNYPLV